MHQIYGICLRKQGRGPRHPATLLLPTTSACCVHYQPTSTAARRFDCSDVDLFHLHHRIERALGGGGIGIGYRSRQCQRRNLPGQTPFVLAPAAVILFAAVADDGVPVTIRFGLVSGCNLK